MVGRQLSSSDLDEAQRAWNLSRCKFYAAQKTAPGFSDSDRSFRFRTWTDTKIGCHRLLVGGGQESTREKLALTLGSMQ